MQRGSWSAGQAGADAPATVVGSEPFGPNDQCNNGGVTVSIGGDADGNGKLDDSEVNQSFDLCSGRPCSSGATPIVVTTNVEPGSECAAGGKLVEVGYDDGADGTQQQETASSTKQRWMTRTSCATASLASLARSALHRSS